MKAISHKYHIYNPKYDTKCEFLQPYTPGVDVLIMLQMNFLIVFLIHTCSFVNFGYQGNINIMDCEYFALYCLKMFIILMAWYKSVVTPVH